MSWSFPDQVLDQIIRPTGLREPISFVYPKSGDYQLLLDSLPKLLQKKPQLSTFLEEEPEQSATLPNFEELFGDE